MAAKRHEIPTHLNVEDKAFLGLSMRQVTYLMLGATGGYGLFTQWPDLSIFVRLALSGALFAASVVLALIRPGGRGLEEWGFALLRHVAVPRVSRWNPREPEATTWQLTGAQWEELAPRPVWEEDR